MAQRDFIHSHLRKRHFLAKQVLRCVVGAYLELALLLKGVRQIKQSRVRQELGVEILWNSKSIRATDNNFTNRVEQMHRFLAVELRVDLGENTENAFLCFKELVTEFLLEH